MSESYNKLVKTLKSIFEMDKADLDFGIYRIMNQKRDDVMRFLENDLLAQVKEAFADYVTDGQSDLQQELDAAIEQAKQFGAPDPEQTPAVQAIRQKMASAVNVRSVENEVYSHLHKFFSRYYDKGDFISQRRYKNDTYAIPYEGEEVKLYWANHDQYYIKSSEHLRDYAFLVQEQDDEKSIRIKLVEADTEKDNVKARSGEERRFVLDEANPLSIEDGELHIHFHYIPVGKKKQEKLNAEAVKLIFEQDGFDEWLELLGQKAPTEKNPHRTVLEKHLNDYTARNTFDYFIHKDLGGFLKRELDFYIKNEVFHLDDIDDAAFEVTEQHLRKIKVLRIIAHKIIRMLAQLEDFQKKLWLKKKFVVETNYCITVDRLAEHTDLLKEVFESEEQLVEWKELFALDLDKLEQDYESMDWEEFLSQPEYQYLVMDTKFFDQEFKDKLIATIADLDEQCDGLLINSDNFQALHLLKETYKNKVSYIYSDPPYNTNEASFLYKNEYKQSSWASMIKNGITLSSSYLTADGIFSIAIDDLEQPLLSGICDGEFGVDGRLGTLVVEIKPSGRTNDYFFATSHEYLLFYSPYRENVSINFFELSDEQISQYQERDKEGAFKWRDFLRTGGYSTPEERPNSFYPIYYNEESGQIGLEEVFGHIEIFPIDSEGKKRVWRKTKPSFLRHLQAGEIKVEKNRSSAWKVRIIDRIKVGTRPKALWTGKQYDASSHGTKLLKSMFGGESGFSFPKSIYAVQDCIHIACEEKNGLVMDCFAGSGTTGHAVINLNRELAHGLKFILIEMGECFNSSTLPRVNKATYSEKWKNGIPENHNGISALYKYIRLESYEDTLNNLILNQTTQKQGEMLRINAGLREDYMLGYMLDVETSNSPSLLNIEQFEDPFNYKLNIGSGSVGATKPVTVDLVETFNYLIGLTVKHIDTLRGFKVVTGMNPQDESVLVIWRNVKALDNAALEVFMEKQGYNPKDTEYDHIYVNGDHTLEDPHSKVKMTEIEFKRLMFDVQDV